MKTVLILTYQSLDNYGQRLQNYAVENILKKYGLEPYSVKILFKKPQKRNLMVKIYLWIFRRYIIKKENLFKKFNDSFLHVHTIKLDEINYDKFDYIAAGSDQIWNQYLPIDELRVYFLIDVEEQKRLLMAPSFGADKIIHSKEKMFSSFLNQLEHCTIREETGKKEIERLTGKSCIRLLDPTLYFSYDKYIGLENKKYKLPNSNYILYFCLGNTNENLLEYVQKYANNKGMILLDIDKLNKNIHSVVGPCEFLKLIRYADVVITNSFHGVAFSIIYKKNFFAFERRKKSIGDSRVEDLLHVLGIENRYTNFSFDAEDIDYQKVEERIKQEKMKWDYYLKQRLRV